MFAHSGVKGKYSVMSEFRTLDDIDVHGKRVLLRADLNIPMRNAL
jgi:phosphoglycerate kinase